MGHFFLNSNIQEEHEKDIFRFVPDELLYLVALTLSNVGVQLIEFRSDLYRRMNVPLITIEHTYLVEDSSLPLASINLSRLGLPLCTPEPIILKTQGDFAKLSYIYRLTKSAQPGSAEYLVLIPASFARFFASELESTEINRPKSFQPSTLPLVNLHSPRPSAVYACLIRLMSCYSKADATRIQLQSDLSQLIMYDMYGLDGFVEEDDVDPEDDPAIQEALDRVREWSKNEEWRKGEEWIGDALGAILEGSGTTGYLPWMR